MESRTVRLVIGLPCSGKTTYIKENFGSLENLEVFDFKEIRKLGRVIRYFQAALFENKTVIIEGVLLDWKSRRKLIEPILNSGCNLECVWINTPLDECLRRNHERESENRVFPRVIKKIAESLEPPDHFEGYRRLQEIKYGPS